MKDSARIFACPSAKAGGTRILAHGVTVALQVLVLSVEVRILMGQQAKTKNQGTRKVKFKACTLF